MKNESECRSLYSIFCFFAGKNVIEGLCSSPRAEDHIICKSNNVHLLNACCELDTGLSTLLILLHLSFPTVLQKAEAQSDFK